jgi:excisionase family DNA binding protein
MHQVRNHVESQRRQYALAERARELCFKDVVVIDEDLGRSGSGQQERPGFGRLLAAVCEGAVGAVFALEASRLARNNREWAHLIDLCALTDALVVDDDGIYDPQQRNDRLLLGLKGTLSQFELDLLRQRGRECRKQLTDRGEVIWEVPVGYVRREDNGLEMIPDRQVQEAIHTTFAKFHELGSARQTLLWYHQTSLLVPQVKPATWGREIEWRLATYGYILRMLQNPTYAGAYAYGRRHSKTVVKDGIARRVKHQKLPVDQWEVLILDHHPGYITWDEYLRNRKALETNSVMVDDSSRGAPRTGPGLLAGLLRCGRCGHKLNVVYSGIKGRVPRYQCQRGFLTHGFEKCIAVGGLRLDRAVSAQVLEALQPLGIQASIDAADQLSRVESDKRKALEFALERARYEAERARRQYDRVEPENRLVAGELEARWNDALRQVCELECHLQAATSEARLTEEERQRLCELGSDLQSLWDHPNTPVPLKKRILRTVLEEIIIDIASDPPQILLRLHWAGGVHTELRVAKNRTGQHSRCTDREVVNLVRELAKVCRDRETAIILNRLGYITGAGNTWKEHRVRSMRQHHKIPAFDDSSPRTWYTLQEAAASLEISNSVIRRLIEEGVLPARQIVRYAPWIIEREHLHLPAVVQAAKAVREGKRTPRTVPGQLEFPPDRSKTP